MSTYTWKKIKKLKFLIFYTTMKIFCIAEDNNMRLYLNSI